MREKVRKKMEPEEMDERTQETLLNVALTYKQAKWACEMLRLGFKQYQVADALGCATKTLRRNLKRYGLPTKFESYDLIPLKYEEEE